MSSAADGRDGKFIIIIYSFIYLFIYLFIYTHGNHQFQKNAKMLTEKKEKNGLQLEKLFSRIFKKKIDIN